MALMTLIQALLITSLAASFLGGARLLVVKWRMHKAEKDLLNDQIIPSGSASQHGMVFKEGTHGVRRDSQATTTWFARLN